MLQTYQVQNAQSFYSGGGQTWGVSGVSEGQESHWFQVQVVEVRSPLSIMIPMLFLLLHLNHLDII